MGIAVRCALTAMHVPWGGCALSHSYSVATHCPTLRAFERLIASHMAAADDGANDDSIVDRKQEISP